MRYFSERETGESPRESEEFGANVWRGLLTVIRSRAADDSFGAQYPDTCDDGPFVCGANMGMFEDAMRAELPGLAGISDRDSGYWKSTLDSLVKTRFEEVPAISHICALPVCWGTIYGI